MTPQEILTFLTMGMFDGLLNVWSAPKNYTSPLKELQIKLKYEKGFQSIFNFLSFLLAAAVICVIFGWPQLSLSQQTLALKMRKEIFGIFSPLCIGPIAIYSLFFFYHHFMVIRDPFVKDVNNLRRALSLRGAIMNRVQFIKLLENIQELNKRAEETMIIHAGNIRAMEAKSGITSFEAACARDVYKECHTHLDRFNLLESKDDKYFKMAEGELASSSEITEH